MDLLQGLQAGALGGFVPRLAVDLACIFVLIRVIYYRTYRRTDLFLTFFSFNLVIFLIAFVLSSVEMTLGPAFVLFAVFSMLRYRTQGISTTDMTYLFLGIALGLVMAVSTAGWGQLVLVGAILLAFTQILEAGLLARREVRQVVRYDRFELVHARERGALVEDLRARTGLDVHRVEVEEIDLLRDSALLAVYYYPTAERAGQPVSSSVPGRVTD